MRYVVASVDVLGSPEQGWEMNDERQIGTIEIDEDVFYDDDAIMDVLAESEYFDPNDYTTVEVDGDESRLVLIDFETGRPLLTLSRAQ